MISPKKSQTIVWFVTAMAQKFFFQDMFIQEGRKDMITINNDKPWTLPKALNFLTKIQKFQKFLKESQVI